MTNTATARAFGHACRGRLCRGLERCVAGGPGWRGSLVLALAVWVALWPAVGHAQPAPERAAETSTEPRPPSPGPPGRTVAAEQDSFEAVNAKLLGPTGKLGSLEGKPIRAVTVESVGTRWGRAADGSREHVTSVRPGEPLSRAAVRRALREVLATGRFAQAQADARPHEDGVILRITAVPRRVVARIKLRGDPLDAEALLAAADVAEGAEITEPMFADIARRIRDYYRRHGYDAATVAIDAGDTDDPMEVVLELDLVAGPRRTVSRRIFVIDPAFDRVLGDLKQEYEVEAGDALDEDDFERADVELGEHLREEGFVRAMVRHRVLRRGPEAFLYVYLDPGPLMRFRFEGHRSFDQDALEDALGLEAGAELGAEQLAARLRDFYAARGFLDAVVRFDQRGGLNAPIYEIRFRVHEGPRVVVSRRFFPCLHGGAAALELGPEDLDDELEGYLTKHLPSTPFFTPPDPVVVDALLGPERAGGRARPVRLSPATTYTAEAYEGAVQHLRDLLSSKGYLNAAVGPVSVVRPRCDPRSRGGACRPLPLPSLPAPQCRRDTLGLPMAEPPLEPSYSCQSDPARGVRCAPWLAVWIPIQLGPRTTLYDIAFEGNRQVPAPKLAEIADLELGRPLSNLELNAARRRLLGFLRDQGYAYATVRSDVELSPDRTRARARFVVNERQAVIITGYEVRGARRTDPDLVLGRLALCQELERCSEDERRYRQHLVRESEELIATLGTFSSVTIGLEDPEIPQRHKRVIITVVEQHSQYLEPRAGFSTGEGVRGGLEYGHRNIGGQAISLTVRVEFSVLPDVLILEQDVLESYQEFTVSERLERSNSLSIRFPEVGLGPRVDLTVDGIDLRDIQRDFALTKEALIPALNYRPLRQLHLQPGVGVEVNDVELFGAEGLEEAIEKRPSLANVLRAPAGRTIALAQRLVLTWDRRNNPFAATSGTLVSTGIEHVDAFPLDDATITSHFVRLTARTAGYLELGDTGLSVAVSLAGGYNLQLTDDSQTYPDRAFYVGGVDTVRGFPLDSLVPEDIAQQVLAGKLDIDDVAIRGGDLYVNPRLELRVPLTDVFSLGLFLDAGNVWASKDSITAFEDLFALRYAVGPGLRLATPIGPVALDFGINLVRRPWEDLGALHFSIGLF